MNLCDHIRKEIDRTGRKHGKIAEITGIERNRMSRYLTGQGGLYPEQLSRLLHELGFKILDPSGKQIYPVGKEPKQDQHQTIPEHEHSVGQ